MGMGWSLRAGVLGCLSFFLISTVHAQDARCAGIIRDVFPLGPDVEVEEVEAINLTHRGNLARYTQDFSVRQQLGQDGRSGYIAVRDEEVAGFVVIRRRNRVTEIESIAVKELKRGIGRDLILRVIADSQKFQGMEELRVLVAFNDEASRAFFKQVGFTEAEVIREKFDGRATSGVLYKMPISWRYANPNSPVPQLQPVPKPVVKSVATQVITLTAPDYETLLREDPTLLHARDKF